MKIPMLAVGEGRYRAYPLLLTILVLFLSGLSVGSEPTKNESKPRKIPRKYDCSGGLKVKSEQGEKYVAQAIDDALNLLKTCSPCHKMFDSEDASYAIDLLEGMKKNNAIIISAKVPREWSLRSDYRKLKVTDPGLFGDAAAIVVDLGQSTSAEMQLPCIYVNSANFVVTGEKAEDFGDFALYGLSAPVQRAVVILHELAHAAGIIQYDGGEPDGTKSVANTNCIRQNCISCKEFESCPNVPESARKHRRKT